MTLIRHCARCKTDFQPHVADCSDCGGPLEERVEQSESPPVLERPQGPAEPPPGTYETLYFSSVITDLDPLADRLTDRGVPYRIMSISEGPAGRCSTRYELRVRDLERSAAREELLAFQGGGIGTDPAQGLDEAFDPVDGYRQCPACSSELQPGTSACPECGLALL